MGDSTVYLSITQVGCTPGGTVSFISPGQGASDRKLVEDSGILDKFEYNDTCMADRGFNIQDLLIIPPFTKGRTQFVKGKVEKTSNIARARIHIERVIGRIKDFRILTGFH